MKKWILSLVPLVFAAAVTAQETNGASENSQWLTEFTQVSVSGPFHIVFEQIPDTEAPRILFDTKGSYTSKFRAEVKEGVLTVTEKFENNRTTVTTVKVCFHKLDNIRVSGATVTFAAPLKAKMMDMEISGGAIVTAPFDIIDLKMDVSGKSRVILSGSTRYLMLAVSTAKVDAQQLDVMACTVDASNKAEVTLHVEEHLVAKASTGAGIQYDGEPEIIRKNVAFTGGEIVKME